MTVGLPTVGSSVVGVELVSEQVVGSTIVRVLRVHDEATGLEGHFPGFAIVPGIVQIQWALDAAGRLAGHPPELRRLETLKFKAVIRPGQRVELAVELSATGDAMHFRIGCGERTFSSGRCVLRQPLLPAS